MSGRKLIHVIGDYGTGDLAFEEVVTGIMQARGHHFDTYRTLSVPPFDTYATGFVLAQLAINSQLGDRHKFFVNTAPRKDDLKARTNNAGEGFVYAKLANGVEICAVNSGFSLSLVKEAAAEIRVIDCDTAGSQFRSRDNFPRAFAEVACAGNPRLLGRAILPQEIPSMPANVLLYTDGYGNLKTSIDPAEIAPFAGRNLQVEIGRWKKPALVSKGIFGVADGELCLSQGSSGWALPGGLRRVFCEVVERGGSAARQFSSPSGGDRISVTEPRPSQR